MPSAPQVHSGVCDYAPAFRSAINDIYNSIQGLTLKDVSGKSGWALSKHAEEDFMSPEIHELPVPDDDENGSPTMSSHEAICLRILSHLDEEEDLINAAMIDKGFYGAYKRNEAALLRNVMKAVRRRTLSTVTSEVASTVRRDLGFTRTANLSVSSREMGPSSYRRPDSFHSTETTDLYNVSPPYSPVSPFSPSATQHAPIRQPVQSPPEPPMSAEEAHRILYPEDEATVSISSEKRPAEENEKFLMGDVMHIENKAMLQEDMKHLRDEKDAALGLGIHKANAGN